jgi:hypothetical protein
MSLWNVFFAHVLSVGSGKIRCLEWWLLEDIYSPNHYSSRWLGFLPTGTSNSLVRTGHDTVQCPVPVTSVVHCSRPLDSPALVAHRTVQ